MAKKNFKIGETFQFGLIRLKCEEAKENDCTSCYMFKFPNACKEFRECIGCCLKEMREDKTDVIFVKVEG